MNRGLFLVMALGACATQDDSNDVTGPYTGAPRRFVIDSFTFAKNNTEARALGRDVNGDKVVDNQVGMVISTLHNYGTITPYGADMLASGAIASSLVMHADDLQNDPTVSVIYYGSDGAPATRVGGTFVDGTFVSNRTATTDVPGDALARLPIFIDAAPSDVPLIGLQIELHPDETGPGYVASISGAVPHADVMNLAVAGLMQVIAADPDNHRTMRSLFDVNNDWQITRAEIVKNTLVESLLAPDVELFGEQAVSFGFNAHLVPCDDGGTCVTSPPANTCFDRVRDGDESDIDCGGSCRPCTAPEKCVAPSDCESNACDAGVCRAATCYDGVRDGFETDVDCGGPCDPCEVGARCYGNGDCETGICGEPCPYEDSFDCIGWYDEFDTCRMLAP